MTSFIILLDWSPPTQIDECPLDEETRVPVLVRTCCGVVEERGLEVVGVYRVPGNSAAVNQLTEQVNRGEFRSVIISIFTCGEAMQVNKSVLASSS